MSIYVKQLCVLFEETGLWDETSIVSKLSKDKRFIDLYNRPDFDIIFQKAKSLTCMSVLSMSFEELMDRWKSGNNKERELNYLTPTESYMIMEKWFKHQKIDGAKFANEVKQVINREVRKKNCLWLQGESNSGKSWIASSILTLCSLYTTIPSGMNDFMFQDCINKRIIGMNEPLVLESGLEQLKEILEGRECNVRVKYKPNQLMSPTPFIITSNFDLWIMNPDAKDPLLNRIFDYRNLKTAPFLKNITKELNPQWLLYFLEEPSNSTTMME
jgi:hypothetical protein